MHREVKEDEMVNALKLRCPLDPSLVPLQVEVEGGHPPDHPIRNRIAQVGKVRGPPSVLVDGQANSHLLG